MNQDSRSRKWQITINNPEDKELSHQVITEILQALKGLLYYCMSDEIGEKNTYHTHIYIVSNNAIRFSTMKKKFPTAHFEIARGTSVDNRDYIFKLGKWKEHKKAETNLLDTHKEWGEIPIERQGARNDLADLYDMIKQGLDNFEILESTPENMLKIDKIEKARQIIKEKEYRNIFRKLSVIYIYGSTATGKTRYIMEKHSYSNVYRITDYKNPFDSYQGQEIVCFEEFRSSLPIASMLNYLDGYPLELPCRYSNKIACYTTVYIVSNIPLIKQYESEQIKEKETWGAFKRRIHKEIAYTKNGCKEKILSKRKSI